MPLTPQAKAAVILPLCYLLVIGAIQLSVGNVGALRFLTDWPIVMLSIFSSTFDQAWYWIEQRMGSSEFDFPATGFMITFYAIVGYISGLMWGKVRKCKRRRRGLCRMCGYDMRYSGPRCPECGTEQEKVPG